MDWINKSGLFFFSSTHCRKLELGMEQGERKYCPDDFQSPWVVCVHSVHIESPCSTLIHAGTSTRYHREETQGVSSAWVEPRIFFCTGVWKA